MTQTSDTAKVEDWEPIDHAIFDAKIRRGLSWRAVGQELNLSHVSCQQRFYKRLRAVTPAEVSVMRAEENLKADEREQLARAVFNAAMTPRVITPADPLLGTEAVFAAPDYTSALNAIKTLEATARSRYKLNGLEVPVLHRIRIEDNAANEIESAISAYLQGRDDATATTGTPS
jgi:hypothetical protein